MTTQEFEQAVKDLGCGHDHQLMYFNGFAQYTSPWWCPAWAKLIAAQRQTRRRERHA